MPIICATVNLHSLVKRGELLEEKMKKAFSLLKGVVDYEEFTDVDMVMEVTHRIHTTLCLTLHQCIFMFSGLD